MVSTRTSITTVLFNLPVFRVYTGWTGTLRLSKTMLPVNEVHYFNIIHIIRHFDRFDSWLTHG